MSLYRIYRHNNELYWDGKLPTDVVLEWRADLSNSDTLAESHVHGITPCTKACGGKNCTRSRIHFHPMLALDIMYTTFRMTFLHEQAHIAALLGNRNLAAHGEAHRLEMLRLASCGAFDKWW